VPSQSSEITTCTCSRSPQATLQEENEIVAGDQRRINVLAFGRYRVTDPLRFYESVANVARNDVIDFLKLAAELNIQPEVERYTLEDANRALLELKNKRVRGAKVLVIDETGHQGNG